MLIKNPIKKRYSVFLSISSVVMMLAVYSFLASRQHFLNPDDTTLPTWTQLYHALIRIFSEQRGEIWILEDVKSSGLRLFYGMSIGIISAVFIGIGMGCHKPVESFFNPILSLAAKIPPTAMLAVFFVISGTDMPLFVTMIVFGILPSLAQSVYLAIKDIHEELINKAHTLGCSYFEIIINVVIPLIMPKIIDSIRLQIGPAMVYLLAAEMIVSDVGFGYRIRMQSRLMNMDVVYIYLSFLAFFGYFVDYSLKLIQKYSCPWFDIEKKD